MVLGMDVSALVEDSTPMAELFLLVSFEIDAPETEISEWLSTTSPHAKIVSELRAISHTEVWDTLDLPLLVKETLIEMLEYINDGITERKEEDESMLEESVPAPSQVVQNRKRGHSVLSPEVLAIVNGEQDKMIMEGDKNEGMVPRADITEDLDLLNMEIRQQGSGIIKEEYLYTRGVGNSSLSIDDLEWTVRVLESQLRHSLAVVRLYTCHDGDLGWKNSNLLGVLALVSETNLQNVSAHFLRLVDIRGCNPATSVIFQQEVYTGLEYHVDAPFFHSFEADNFLVGLSFADLGEANLFYKKVSHCLGCKAEDVLNDHLEKKEETFMVVGDNFVSKRLSASVGREDMINLLSNPQPLIPSNVVSFNHGNDSIADGISVVWKSNAKQSLDLEPIYSPEKEIASCKLRCKHLLELKKNATIVGDFETANSLKKDIEVQKKEIKQLQASMSKKKPFKVKKFWK